MAVREFDGTDDEIYCATGNLSGMTYGTMATLVKPAAFEDRVLLELYDDNDDVVVGWSLDRTGGAGGGNRSELFNPSTGEDPTTDFVPMVVGTWYLLVMRAGSGNTVPRLSIYDFDGDSWSHHPIDDDVGDTFGDWAAPGVSGSMGWGDPGNGFVFEGLVAASAMWANTLPWSDDASGDSAIEVAGLETSAVNWFNNSPTAMWRLNQDSTTTDITDDTGNGADQAFISGTTVINGDDPPGFNFSITGTPIGQATETDTAQPITAAKTQTVVQATETDAAQSITPVATIVVPIGQATETDDAQEISPPAPDGPIAYDVRIDWDNDGDYDDTGENVTPRARTDVHIQYGRDQARALSPIQPGQATVELDNTSKDYTPGNAASPLFGLLEPGRRLRIQATIGDTYDLYRGNLDEYNLRPGFDDRYVAFTALDALGRLSEDEISTELHHGIRTGKAINLILDAVGWPEADRDIDQGATTIPWWWEDRADPLTALERIVTSEGPPALATVGADGAFVFRDRHHRLTRSASLTSQATFRGSGTVEPVIVEPFGYDLGWRDIVNSVTLSVEERAPAGVAEQVWSDDQIHSVADGETLTIRTQPSDPVLDAITPVEGTDYRLRSGTVTMTLSRTSGTAISIMITGVGGPAVLDQLQLRAVPVSVRRTVQIHAEDAVSVEKYGTRAPTMDAPWVNVHDALAIAEVTLARRAERLPTIQARLVSGLNDSERLVHQLTRDLSDRVTVTVDLPSVDDDFYIEQIRHLITQAGTSHETVFGCEQVPTQVDDAFAFDVAGRGFDDGKFAKQGLDDPDVMFRFDTAGQGFDDGVFAT